MNQRNKRNSSNKIVCCHSTVWGYDNMEDDNQRKRPQKNCCLASDKWDKDDNDYNQECEREYEIDDDFDKRERDKSHNRCCICRIFDCIFGW